MTHFGDRATHSRIPLERSALQFAPLYLKGDHAASLSLPTWAESIRTFAFDTRGHGNLELALTQNVRIVGVRQGSASANGEDLVYISVPSISVLWMQVCRKMCRDNGVPVSAPTIRLLPPKIIYLSTNKLPQKMAAQQRI